MLPAGAKPETLVFSCRPDNDLYRALAESGSTFPRYDSPTGAVEAAPRGGGVLLLADGYPSATTEVSPVVWRSVDRKKLRVFIEYSSSIPGMEWKPPATAGRERIVVASGAFGPNLPPMRILSIHESHFLPVEAPKPDLVLARVAGFNSAIYGLPSAGVFPILFEDPRGNILVATTKLSQFVTARYAPADAWPLVWRRILTWVAQGGVVPEVHPLATVRPSFAKMETIPRDGELRAFSRGVGWYARSRMLIDASWKERAGEAAKYKDRVGAGPDATRLPAGNGSAGVLEGFSSSIQEDGSQLARWWIRADCVSETAMALAFSGRLEEKPERLRAAANLQNFLYYQSPLAQGARSDPRNAAYGLLGWNTAARYYRDLNGYGVYYGDDNARAMLGTMATAALLGSGRWNLPLIRALLANFRTTGKLGFRIDRIDQAPLERNGWQHYNDGDVVSYSPHYQAYLWACMLWAYRQTGYEPFLARSRNAIKMTMEAYPDNWHWTNGIQQERARMLLPLAWLVRLENTGEHRAWLHRISADLLAAQDDSGAIREEIGAAHHGAFGPPQSNEEYGTREAPLIQENGDPVADLLYTTNFAFLGLHEAAAATGDAAYERAVGKLAQFLVRVQVRSESHPELDGAWFRAFDFKNWEYWASNADSGWGAWSAETGWTQSWITSVLGMRQLKTCLWDLTQENGLKREFARLRDEMLAENAR